MTDERVNFVDLLDFWLIEGEETGRPEEVFRRKYPDIVMVEFSNFFFSDERAHVRWLRNVASCVGSPT